jgi:hypothetical protein
LTGVVVVGLSVGVGLEVTVVVELLGAAVDVVLDATSFAERGAVVAGEPFAGDDAVTGVDEVSVAIRSLEHAAIAANATATNATAANEDRPIAPKRAEFAGFLRGMDHDRTSRRTGLKRGTAQPCCRACPWQSCAPAGRV